MAYKISANVILLLVLFPYVTPFKTPFDIQPWMLIVAFLFAMGLMLKDKFSFPLPLGILFFIALYALFIYSSYSVAGRSDPLGGFRSLVGYLSVFLFTLVSYKTYRYAGVKPYIAAVVIWLLVALIQLTVDIRFAEWIVPRLSTEGVRGVTSLAPEPAFYARMGIVMFILNEVFYKERRYGILLYLVILLAVVFQVIISFSGTGLLFLMVALVAKSFSLWLDQGLKKWRAASLLAATAIAASIFLFTQLSILQESRAVYLLRQIASDPVGLLQKDPSVSLRLANPLLAVYGGLVRTRGFGFGLATIEQEEVPEWVTLWLGIERTWGGRTLGGLVSAIYELGVVGVLLLFTVIWIMVASVLRNRRMRATCLLGSLVFLPLMTAVGSLAFPLFGYVMGIHAYYAYADPLRLRNASAATVAS